ncbi:centriolar coiled-coil protein of 110 kDa isoform X2 [Triplophysa rosa]|uniref:centriolar coiled-coil protein of 110 kDa isoform X2 n=1 Tax=Triplophysa rosa TaxID=992332 RepID=UPI00254628C4|nr:centriolar coiled-coil protein of 110 kDa isoform X2 [Triplophysa rosa]
MESYEDFIQRHRESPADDDDEDEESVSKPSSVIVFHGVCVLPPLLSERQRDQMRLLRETVLSVMKSRRQKTSDSEFKRETVTADVQTSSTEHQTSDDITQSQEIFTCPPLTSTAHDAQPANQPRAFPVEDSLEKTQITGVFHGAGTARGHSDKHPLSDISHQMMMSSGYVTNENTHVTCDDSSWVENNGSSAGFCLNTTRSPSTGSDIISHAPVDGSALEEETADSEPYRMSLQNLLKKSQDYRRRQRLLRSQAPTLESTDEHGLSDKENQEFLPNQIWRAELSNARERRKVKLQHSDADTETSDGRPEEHHDSLTEESTSAKSLYLSKQKPVAVCRSSSAAGRKFSSVPAPKFCLSPARSKKACGGVPVRKTAVCVEREEESLSSRTDDGGAHVDGSSQQTQQIAQLEFNLSSLKALISDLESTLTSSRTENSSCTLITHPSHKPSGVLIDSSNHKQPHDSEEKKHCSLIGSSFCQSYDVDAPSSLWTQLTPETGAHEGVSRAKRRLLMNAMSPEPHTVVQTSAQPQSEDRVRVLLEDERRRQQDLLQSLAVRYQFLRSVSFPRPSMGARLEDTSTSSVFTSPSRTHHTSRSCLSLPASCRPLLAAAVKGFLTRRLLRTERVSQLVRTVQDTQQFLHQTTVRGDFSSRQDLMLQERVSLQLRAARYEFHNIMFNSSICERMKMIHQDRQVTRERRFREHGNKLKGSLSAATRKALERKKLAMLQRKSTVRSKFSPSGDESWTLVPKICRVSKKTSPR